MPRRKKKAAERAVEVSVEVGSDTASAKPHDPKPSAVDTAPPGSDKSHTSDEPKKSDGPESSEEPGDAEAFAALSPPSSALAPAPLPRIEGYGVPSPNGVDDEDQDESGLSIRPNVPTRAKEEHADASILAIEPSADSKRLNMAAPFAPAPRRTSENVTLAIIVVIALAAGWILSALFSR